MRGSHWHSNVIWWWWCDMLWVMWCDVMRCVMKSMYVMWCNAKWWCEDDCCDGLRWDEMYVMAMLRIVMWRGVTWRNVLWYDVIWYDVMWCDVLMWCYRSWKVDNLLLLIVSVVYLAWNLITSSINGVSIFVQFSTMWWERVWNDDLKILIFFPQLNTNETTINMLTQHLKISWFIASSIWPFD